MAAAIDNGRLFESAQQAVTMREEFLTVAAHELRTPMTSLQLALQSLSRQARGDEQGEGARAVNRMLDIAERQAMSLNRLVEMLLDASSIASGSLPVVLAEVDLSDTVRSVVARLSEQLRASGSALTLGAREPAIGRWDRSRVEQVVTNLLSNAIKYGEGGPIEVGVEADDDVARLVVRDHGMGIPPEALGRIFGRFERAVSLRHYGGLGLGLYIVRRIAERLGGTVECASTLHAGSTFTVTLPRKAPIAVERRDGGTAA